MEEGPDLLADGPEPLVLDLVEIQHPEQVDDQDGADDLADHGRGEVGAPLHDVRDGFGHADDAFAHDDQRQQADALDQMRVLEADDAPLARRRDGDKRFDPHHDVPAHVGV